MAPSVSGNFALSWLGWLNLTSAIGGCSNTLLASVQCASTMCDTSTAVDLYMAQKKKAQIRNHLSRAERKLLGDVNPNSKAAMSQLQESRGLRT